MGRLLDQFCVACEESITQSPSGHTLALLILALLGGWPEIDPQVRLDPYLATVAHVRITLERWLQGSWTSELSLALGLIWAIGSVLEDCAHEHVRNPGEDWSPATQRLLRYGVLIDAGGVLAVIGETEIPVPDRIRRARADLELWSEVTAPILEHENLEQAIRDEMEDR